MVGKEEARVKKEKEKERVRSINQVNMKNKGEQESAMIFIIRAWVVEGIVSCRILKNLELG